MILDCSAAESLSQIAADSGWSAVGAHEFSVVTLPGLLELSRAVACGGAPASAAAERCVGRVPGALEVLSTAGAMWQGRFNPQRAQAELFAAPKYELWLVRSAACIESNEFSLFAHRFQRRLNDCGFGLRFPYALSQALIEMTENVVRHSAPPGTPPAVGLVAYHVIHDEMNYFVADRGRGVWRSLRDNPKWAALASEGDALVAAAKDGATRAVAHTEGDGFRVAFQGFLDRAGVLAMRSGDGLARISGNLDGREAEVCNAAPLTGLRVAAACSLRGTSGEITFNI